MMPFISLNAQQNVYFRGCCILQIFDDWPRLTHDFLRLVKIIIDPFFYLQLHFHTKTASFCDKKAMKCKWLIDFE